MRLMVILLLLLAFLGCCSLLFFNIWGRGQEKGDLIAVINLKGIILNTDSEGETINSDRVVKVLDDISKKSQYKGILLVVDSPGGMAAPSLEISYKINQIKMQKPVVVYIQNLGASGAYYFSSAASYIVSNPEAIIGSIGVIISIPQIHKALDKIGIQVINIKSGKYKDSLSPYKPISDDQKNYLQDLVMEYYYQFVRDVAKNRGFKTEKQIRELYSIADGRVFSSRTALEYRLIDEIGVIDDAKNKIKSMVKNDKVKFVEIKLRQISPLERLLGNTISDRVLPRLRYGVWMILD